MITIGVDPHKSSHTAVAVDDDQRALGELRVLSGSKMTATLLAWAARWPDERVWAIEGCEGLGRLLAQQLVASGETVLEVPATLTARTRMLRTGHGRKTDGIDALSVAQIAAARPQLRRVVSDDHTTLLRLLADQRTEIAQQRRQAVNRLHRHLRDLIAGGVPTSLSAAAASKALARVRPGDPVQAERKRIARQLIGDIRRLDRALDDNRQRTREAVAACGTTLTETFGISDVLAAKIIGHTGPINRFASADAYANYTGTAPIEVSSGGKVRHRLSRAGNRQLNSAIHLAAHVQRLHPGQGRDYYLRKIDEGKTPKEALRCLKRQVTKAVYRALKADAERAVTAHLDTAC